MLLDTGYATRLAFSNWPPRDNIYPPQAVAYLEQHPCKGNLFNSYNYGGYLIWKLPNTPVYIDGRMPIWRDEKGEKYFDTYLKVFHDDNVRKAEFSKYNITCVLLIRDVQTKKLVNRLKIEGWSEAAKNNDSILLEKSN